MLARTGYFPVGELATFRKLDSRLQGHPTTAEHLPGVRIASGSLGQGLSVAAGAAFAKKLNKDDKHVYCLMGDGEQQEGQVWEAAQFAPNKKLGNLTAIIDYNLAQIDGTTMGVNDNRDLAAKYRAFGWKVTEMQGNDMGDIIKTLKDAKYADTSDRQDVPTLILMHTLMGYGVDFMAGNYKWHGTALNTEQMANALGQLPVFAGMEDY